MDLECREASSHQCFQRWGPFGCSAISLWPQAAHSLRVGPGNWAWHGASRGLASDGLVGPHRIVLSNLNFNTARQKREHSSTQQYRTSLSLHDNLYRKPAFPETPWLRIACNPPTGTPNYHDPACSAIQTLILTLVLPPNKSCIGQAQPNAAMQRNPTIREYLEIRRKCSV
jgi:hypothetical protein